MDIGLCEERRRIVGWRSTGRLASAEAAFGSHGKSIIPTAALAISDPSTTKRLSCKSCSNNEVGWLVSLPCIQPPFCANSVSSLPVHVMSWPRSFLVGHRAPDNLFKLGRLVRYRGPIEAELVKVGDEDVAQALQ